MLKIKENMTTIQIATAMADGNIGALTTVIAIIRNAGTIDPDDPLGGLGTLLHMDILGIHGEKVWILFKYACGQDLSKMVGVVRACQLGYVTPEMLDAALASTLDVDGLVAKVKERLPRFGVAA